MYVSEALQIRLFGCVNFLAAWLTAFILVTGDYSVNFNNFAQPLPNWYIIAPDILYYSNHSVKGLFEEGPYRGPGGDMAPLKVSLLTYIYTMTIVLSG